MRILIAGIDGYLGWPLALHLGQRGHEIAGLDGYQRRRWVQEVGSQTAIPIEDMEQRIIAYREHTGDDLGFVSGDVTDYAFVCKSIENYQPEAVVHLAENPSAPFSMMDADHCILTHTNNLNGTLNILHAMRDLAPEAHLLKLGTMGEYGTPNIDIPEGSFDIEYRGRRDTLPFPRQANSWYHQTKVHDSNNIAMACRLWGLRSTDIMQGVVYGTRTPSMKDDPRLATRFDFDQCFGTVINRFCAQAAIGIDLTVYGHGGQRRGFLPLRDSIQCLTLALENPPQLGEYRVFNQFEEVYSILDLAKAVAEVAVELGLNPKIQCIQNPRIESEDHYYKPDHQRLFDLGYVPTRNICGEVKLMLEDLLTHRNRVFRSSEHILPNISWKRASMHVNETFF